jgi:hypothetical protein
LSAQGIISKHYQLAKEMRNLNGNNRGEQIKRFGESWDTLFGKILWRDVGNA